MQMFSPELLSGLKTGATLGARPDSSARGENVLSEPTIEYRCPSKKYHVHCFGGRLTLAVVSVVCEDFCRPGLLQVQRDPVSSTYSTSLQNRMYKTISKTFSTNNVSGLRPACDNVVPGGTVVDTLTLSLRP